MISRDSYTTIDKLRRDATKLLSQRVGNRLVDIEEPMWQHAVEEGYVRQAINDPDASLGLEDLVDFLTGLHRYTVAREEWKAQASARPSALLTKSEVQLELEGGLIHLTNDEIERGNALAEYLAKIATANRDVRGFRAAILNNQLLTLEGVDKFLTSPAIRYLDQETFVRNNIPFVLHEATQRVGMMPPISSRRYNLKAIRRRGGHTRKGRRDKVILDIKSYPDQRNLTLTTTVRKAQQKTFTWTLDSGASKVLAYNEGSVLGILIDPVSKVLARFNWSTLDSIRFLAAGVIPQPQPLNGQIRVLTGVTGGRRHTQTLITLTSQAWVSAESVMNTYRRAQQHVQLHIAGHNSTRYSSRPLGKRKLALFRFVTSQMEVTEEASKDTWDSNLKLPLGKQLMEMWNANQPKKWKYNQMHHFWRDINDAWREITGPYHNVPHPIFDKAPSALTKTVKDE